MIDIDQSDASPEAVLVARYRDAISYGLAVVGSVVMLPFSVNNFLQGRIGLGIATSIVVAMLVMNGVGIFRQRRTPVPLVLIFVPAVVGLLISVRTQIWPGILWSYPAVLMFHFMLSRRMANMLNAIMATVVPLAAWQVLPGALALRVAVTLALMIMFANIFSFVTTGLYRQLVRQKELAEQATRFKSDFLANMSHEIRTPMNAVIGLTYLALQTELTPRQRDYLDKVQHAARALLGVINDILDFSKVEAGKLSMETTEFALAGVLDQLASISALPAQEKALDVVFDVAADVPQRLLGDPLRLGQILVNLLNNAIKFTEHGEVVLSIAMTRRTDTRAHLSFALRDRGIGIGAEHARALFAPYSQAEESTSRRFGGTGLGLAICKQLAEAMGGHIALESEPGRGSVFTFSVELALPPQAPPHAAMAPAIAGLRLLVGVAGPAQGAALVRTLEGWGALVAHAADANALGDALQSGGPGFSALLLDPAMAIHAQQAGLRFGAPGMPPLVLLATARGPQLGAIEGAAHLLRMPLAPHALRDGLAQALGRAHEAGAMAPPAPLRRLDGVHVLVAEDNEINQQVVRELLHTAGARCTIVADGGAAVQRALQADDAVDVVLMDIQMPRMDGIEATLQIRAQRDAASLPVVGLSAHVLQNERQRCHDAGMNDYLTKPVDPALVLDTLARYLGPERLEQAAARTAASVPAAPAASAAAALPATLPGIDMADGLQRCCGNDDLYRDLLLMFHTRWAGSQPQLRQMCDQGRHDEAAMFAHTVRGSAANLGARGLAAATSAVEQAIAGQQLDALPAALEAFEAALGQVIAGLAPLKGGAPEQEAAQDGEAGMPAALAPLLDELALCLGANDTRAEALLAQMRALYAGAGPGWLRAAADAVEALDYAAALAVLPAHRVHHEQ